MGMGRECRWWCRLNAGYVLCGGCRLDAVWAASGVKERTGPDGDQLAVRDAVRWRQWRDDAKERQRRRGRGEGIKERATWLEVLRKGKAL